MGTNIINLECHSEGNLLSTGYIAQNELSLQCLKRFLLNDKSKVEAFERRVRCSKRVVSPVLKKIPAE